MVSFEDIFNNNKNSVFSSCDGVSNNSRPEVGVIRDGAQKVASETSVDHRFILTITMQESTGWARVRTTGDANHRSSGLIQDHNGRRHLQREQPRTAGTRDGDGLAQGLNVANRSELSAFYCAARMQNSGDILGDLNSDGTRCNVSNTANRLTGWVNAGSKRSL